VNTAEGVLCRGVADELPKEAQSVEPTLEDAYLYLITQEGKTQ
jgi:ABC-2 type transport system ATP-binding protein